MNGGSLHYLTPGMSHWLLDLWSMVKANTNVIGFCFIGSSKTILHIAPMTGNILQQSVQTKILEGVSAGNALINKSGVINKRKWMPDIRVKHECLSCHVLPHSSPFHISFVSKGQASLSERGSEIISQLLCYFKILNFYFADFVQICH